MLSARPSPNAKVANWMIFSERLFTSSQLRGVNVEWNDWCQFVLVRNTSGNHILGKPSVVGARILYLDQDPTGTKTRINAINFAPHSDSAQTSQAMWDFVGKRSLLVPTESKREISSVNERGGSKLLDLRATEDNIVLLYVRVQVCRVTFVPADYYNSGKYQWSNAYQDPDLWSSKWFPAPALSARTGADIEVSLFRHLNTVAYR